MGLSQWMICTRFTISMDSRQAGTPQVGHDGSGSAIQLLKHKSVLLNCPLQWQRL